MPNASGKNGYREKKCMFNHNADKTGELTPSVPTFVDPPDAELKSALRRYVALQLKQVEKLERLKAEFGLDIQ